MVAGLTLLLLLARMRLEAASSPNGDILAVCPTCPNPLKPRRTQGHFWPRVPTLTLSSTKVLALLRGAKWAIISVISDINVKWAITAK